MKVAVVVVVLALIGAVVSDNVPHGKNRRYVLDAYLLSDADGDDHADPGDVIRYTLTGSGAFKFKVGAETVSLKFLAGSVKLLKGEATIVKGNSPRDKQVVVDSSRLSNHKVVFTFDAVVKEDQPEDIQAITLQGEVIVDGEQLYTTSTVGLASHPTVVALDANAFMDVSLEMRAVNGQAKVKRGDVVEFVSVVANHGNQRTRQVEYFCGIPKNVDLVKGSVVVDGASVLVSPEARLLQLPLGSLSAGEERRVTFRATVARAGNVVTQARVCNLNAAGAEVCQQSHDPAAATTGSERALARSPYRPVYLPSILHCEDGDVYVHASKSVAISGLPVALRSGEAVPGSTLTYSIKVSNLDGEDVDNVRVLDKLPEGVTLVYGTVATTQGSVVYGNNYAPNYYWGESYPERQQRTANNRRDTVAPQYLNTVVVEVGTLSPLSPVIITFCVTVNDVLYDQCILNQAQVTWGSDDIEDPDYYYTIDKLSVYPVDASRITVTDDPTTPVLADPTQVCIDAGPVIEASNAWKSKDGEAGSVGAGGVVCYTAKVTNTGAGTAEDVVFSEVLDKNTYITVGSVRSDCGTVTSGNAPWATDVEVQIPSIPPKVTCTITFDATIVDPFPAEDLVVSTQGVVSGSNFESVVTDDPTTGLWDDATVVPITANPVVAVHLDDALAVDYNYDHEANPGDEVALTLTIENSGNTAATDVLARFVPDHRATLVRGSVATSAGSVEAGNSEFDDSVEINVGVIPAGTVVTASFNVQVRNPFPAGDTHLVHQAVVSYVSLGRNYVVVSADPSSSVLDDPTYTDVITSPHLTQEAAVSFVIDQNDDGLIGPGDILSLTGTLTNDGNQDLSDLVFTGRPTGALYLEVGTVEVSEGSVVVGNSPGDPVDYALATLDYLPAGEVYTFTGQFGVYDSVSTETDTAGAILTAESAAEGVEVSASLSLSVPIAQGAPAVSMTLEADVASASPGSTVVYTATVRNDGTVDAEGVSFSVPYLDENTAFVLGSAVISQGRVVEGLSVADENLVVSLGSIAGGTYATVVFDVQVADVLPVGVTELSSQAVLTGDNFADVVSTYEASRLLDAPTVTPVPSDVHLVFELTAGLTDDVNQNGLVDPGDGVTYYVNLLNVGNQDAGDVVVSHVTPGGLLFLAGSVTTDAGKVTTGNGAYDAGFQVPVEITIGTLAGAGGSASMSFQAIVETPWELCSNTVGHQAIVSGTGFSTQVSDNPNTNLINDPTFFDVNARPIMAVNRYTGADDGVNLTPLSDTVDIDNTGLQDACDVVVDIRALGPVDSATIEVSSGSFLYNSDSLQIVWTVGTLGAESEASISFSWNRDDFCADGDSTTLSGSNFESIELPGSTAPATCVTTSLSESRSATRDIIDVSSASTIVPVYMTLFALLAMFI
eukprot:CAMPEP_0119118496 /NCGR_PEP_ID=MMETSP1310-20130426/348_1 /TAXON_ID=464262 /ORGANISM="Genus nov. species nov., Strain RCC2339" /LENGTH=1399 /DNA_ID=CAMNT_0007107863 /DNA_START=91 /DNA_END=4290 /DNA_ORIENTATION=-